MSKSYLPSLEDKHGNVIIGLMGQFDDRGDALDRKLADGIFWIPFGLSPGEIIEYDSEQGLPNLKATFMRYECAIIAGPKFDERMNGQEDEPDDPSPICHCQRPNCDCNARRTRNLGTR